MTYTYTCTECSNSEERRFSIKDDLPKNLKCSKCGKKTLKRDFAADLGTAQVRIPHMFMAVR